jgi:hypothetical protein
MVKMDQYHKVGGYYWQIPWVLVNLCFQQDSIRKSVRRIKTSNRIKLNHDENYSKMFQRTPEDTTLQWTPRGCQVGPTGPTTMPPGPLWGPLLGAFRMFLHRLLGLHLRRSLSRFDPRAQIAPLGIYIQACTPLERSQVWILRAERPGTLIHISTRI